MKKIALGLSLMMALLAAPATFAASQQNESKKECTEQTCPDKKECKKEGKKECKEGKKCCKQEGKKECKDKKKCCKEEGKKECKKGADGRMAGRGEGRGKKMDKESRRAAMFEGITLSEAQQQQLQTLDNKVKAERQAAKVKMDEEKQKMKEKAEMGREKFRAEYDKALKDILTPEQYAKYQENQKAAQAKRAEKKAAKEAKKAAKAEKRGDKKGDRRGNDKNVI